MLSSADVNVVNRFISEARDARIINKETGLAKRTALPTNNQIQTCARCHARRITLKEDYVHGAPLTDSYRPQVLLQDLYFPDGQIQDEVYVYGSFIQSRMFSNGVTCSDCHDPHRCWL